MGRASSATRRSYLKTIGTVVGGGATSLAGCLGEGGGDTETVVKERTVTKTVIKESSKEPKSAIAAIPPGGWGAILRLITQEHNLFEKYSAEVGREVTIEFKNTWDDIPTWISGHADIAQFGGLEASRIGPRRDIPISIFGKIVPVAFSPFVKTDGKYDPSKWNSLQELVDAWVSDSAKFGIGSWGGADPTAYDVAFGTEYGYRFKEDGGDFNVVTAGYPTLGQLAAEGKIDVASTGDAVGGAPQMANGSITPTFWVHDLIPEVLFGESTEFGFPTMQNMLCRTEFYDANPDVVKVYYEAMNEAMTRLHENPVDILTKDEEHVETILAPTEEVAEFIAEFGINLQEFDHISPPSNPSIYPDISISDDYIEKDVRFLDEVADRGLTDSNWSDYVEHVKI